MVARELKDTNEDKKEENFDGIGARHTLAFMGFLAIMNVYTLRVNLSVAIVAMVNGTTSTSDSDSNTCPSPDVNNTADDSFGEGEFDWDESTQGLVLGSFFYGYALTNILGGRAAEYFGGKIVVGVGVAITGILTLLSPMAARVSSGLFIALRVLEGCSSGVAYPGMNTLITNWYPTEERSKFASYIFVGMQFGTILSLMCSGWLSASDFLGGWPSAFYTFGALAIVWSAFWFLLITDSPRDHPRISEAEKEYILRGCPKQEVTYPMPLRDIATSVPFWAIILMHFGNNWGLYTLLTVVPTYLDQILHVDMSNNGLYSALPYFGGWVFSVLFSVLTGYFLNKEKMSLLAIRRWAMVFAGYGPMLCLVGMCFVNCNSALALTVLILSGTLNGSSYCGYMSSHADIAPRFAGTLMGLTNTVATIPGFVSPSVTGALTQDNQTIEAWRMVFIISVCVYFVTCSFYLYFITTEKQPWNEPKETLDPETAATKGPGEEVKTTTEEIQETKTQNGDL